MNRRNLESDLGDLKAELKSSGLSRREAFMAAVGAACPLLLVLSGGKVDAKKRCEVASCEAGCRTCSEKCSTGKSGDLG